MNLSDAGGPEPRPPGLLRRLATRLFGGFGPAAPLSESQAKADARHRDPARRRRVAADSQVAPELLYYLARDVSPVVRLAVAQNPRTPRQADLMLAVDEQAEIRTAIARKVTGQLGSMPRDDRAQIWQLTLSLLEALARDDLSGVRQLVAESARDLARLPPALACTLARDREASVAVPALGYPGRLADQELVEVVVGAHDQRIIGAVARRPSIGAIVSDAVVERGDESAIGILLENRTAEIRPVTLEGVIDRAPGVRSWHEALVARPDLTRIGADRLAQFVEPRLVAQLEARPDLNRGPEPPAAAEAADADPSGEAPREDPAARAARLHADGGLSEEVVIEAIGTDLDFLLAALALKSRLPPAAVAKIFAANSANAFTALAWRAGYSMRLALQLQLRIGRLPHKARLGAVEGGWPLSRDEMTVQIEFFRSLASRS